MIEDGPLSMESKAGERGDLCGRPLHGIEGRNTEKKKKKKKPYETRSRIRNGRRFEALYKYATHMCCVYPGREEKKAD